MLPEVNPALFADSPLLRLRWLVQLRWIALGAVVVGLGVARSLRLPFVAPRPIIAALLVGVLYNLGFIFRLRRLHRLGLAKDDDAPDAFRRELELHAIADVGALTLLLSACGGLRNPISTFYGFHVVLGAVLGRFRGAMLASAVALLGVSLLWSAERSGLLLAPVLFQPPAWLCAGAITLNVLSLGYFAQGALRFWQRAEGRALRNYRLLLKSLDELHAGLELVGPGDRLLLANRRAAAIHPTEAARWHPPVAVIPAPSDGRRLIRAETGEPGIFEIVALSGEPDGLRAFLYIDRTEATLGEQRAMMLERLASLGRVLQQVAHELNTPLATIQTLAVDVSHALRDRAAPSGAAPAPCAGPPVDEVVADVTESITLIIDEARRCRAITHDLLATARSGGDASSSARRLVVLREVIARAVRLAYGGKPGQGGVIVSGSADLCCVTDGDRLLQILVNLLQNARDASDAPVTISVDVDQGTVNLTVRDRGPGLPAEVRERLFTPFVTTKPPGQGTGLGLYTCAVLARQIDAVLTIDNPPGGGVQARLRLPLRPAEGGAPP